MNIVYARLIATVTSAPAAEFVAYPITVPTVSQYSITKTPIALLLAI